MTFHVDSEVGVLKQVVLHRPGLELSRLTPQNVDDLLFDDVMWAQRAREEHDAFAQKLKDKGVEVHLFAELLADVLSTEEGREFVLERVANKHTVGPQLVAPLRELAESVDGATMADYFIGGILKRDLQLPRGSSASLGPPRRLRLRPHAPAEPPVPARQHRVRLRRPLGAPDGQARTPARDSSTPGRSGTSTRSSATRGCTSTTATTTTTTSRRPARAATSW